MRLPSLYLVAFIVGISLLASGASLDVEDILRGGSEATEVHETVTTKERKTKSALPPAKVTSTFYSPTHGYNDRLLHSSSSSNEILATNQTATGPHKLPGITLRSLELEAMLGSKLHELVRASEKERHDAESLREHRLRCYAVPRKQAQVVEAIIRDQEDPRVTLYMLLGVGRSVERAELRNRYRALALLLHPDKNQHPDAQTAFDAITFAYKQLTSATERGAYDRVLQAQQARRFSVWHWRRQMTAWIFNTKSLLLVAWFQLRRGELQLNWTAAKAAFYDWGQTLVDLGQHLALLPTWWDRVLLLHEVWRRNRFTLWAVAVGIALQL